jgi:hypothetical protein
MSGDVGKFEMGRDPGTDEEVAQVLASHGLTIETANDSWQFAVKLLTAHVVDSSSNVFDRDAARLLLQHVNEETSTTEQPAGLYHRDQDQFPRFDGLKPEVRVRSAHTHRM